MVRKEGYFSITDACIKHCRADFLIMRPPPKKPLESFCARWGGEEECGGHWGVEENVPLPAVLLPGWDTPWEQSLHQLGRLLVGNKSDKGYFVMEKEMISQGSGLLVPGMGTPGGGTAQGARLEGQSLLKHSSGRVCSSINIRGHF